MSELISVDEALALISAHQLTTKTETVKLAEALDRTLATDLIAQTTRPPAAVSAMDGYAVRITDIAAPNTILEVIGEAPAGTPFDRKVKANQAVRIFTGGELPSGTNHVVIQENTQRNANKVTCLIAEAQPRFIRRAGLDFSEGETLLTAGTKIGAAELSIAAAANHAELNVIRRPRVGILANGNELKPPGTRLNRGDIINSNPAGLAALITRWGGEPVDLGIAGDSVPSILRHIEAGKDIDIFMPVGGASVGDHDHMRSAFSEAGFKPIFEKVAVKPGKPTWFSQRGPQRVLGLPGNPASALVCAHLFGAPLLRQSYTDRQILAQLAAPLSENGPREQFLRAEAKLTANGAIAVRAADNQDSSLLKPFLTCNALIRRHSKAMPLEQGQHVPILLIRPLQT